MSTPPEQGRDMLEIARMDELKRELQGFDPEAYFDKLRKADKILMVLSCCDARVGGQTEHGGVIIDWIPNIGGTIPQEEELQAIFDTYVDKGIDLNKVTILASAHGTHDEIQDKANTGISPACGARGVAKAIKEGADIHEAAHHHDVTVRTVEVAASRGGAFTMADSVNYDKEHLTELVNTLGVPVKVGGSYFDNNAQVLHIEGVEGVSTLKTHDEEWEHSHQDPKRFVLSVGSIMSVASIETQYEGAQETPGFSFDSEAAITPKMIENNREAAAKIVLEALAMIDYAASNANANFKKHGQNFANPEMVLFRADSEVEYQFLLDILNSEDETAVIVRGHLETLSKKNVGVFAQILNGKDGQKEVRKVPLAA